jgi:glutamyl-tRNA reductase
VALDLVIVGLSHHTAPVEVREKLSLGNGTTEQVLAEMVATPSVREVVLLSTCNRVEVVACCEQGSGAESGLTSRLLSIGGLERGAVADSLFELHGRDAVRHVFRVAASLDSMVVGEPQILGQVKQQFEACDAAEAVGPVLHRVFHKSFSVAKRVRSETGVAGRAVSVASIAADLAGQIFEDLRERVLLVLGAGEIGEAAAAHFVAAGVRSVMVTNRTFEAAVDLARRYRGTPIPFERMATYLPLADLVIGSASSGQILEAGEVRRVMKERKNRPMFFIDLAVPRNFDPAINDIDNAYIYDVDDLANVADDNLGERRREAVRGEAIVEQEVDRFWQWFERLELEPTIAELRALAERVRQQETDRTMARLGHLSEVDRERIDQMSRAIVNKLLHQPTTRLKQADETSEEVILVSAIRRLFGLESDD